MRFGFLFIQSQNVFAYRVTRIALFVNFVAAVVHIPASAQLATTEARPQPAAHIGCVFPAREPQKTQDATALSLLQTAIARGQVIGKSSSPIILRGTVTSRSTNDEQRTQSYTIEEGPGVLRRTTEDRGSPSGDVSNDPLSNTVTPQRRSIRPLRKTAELLPIIKMDLEDKSVASVELLASDQTSITVRVLPVLASHDPILMDNSGPIVDLVFDATSRNIIRATIRSVGCEAVTVPPITFEYANFQPNKTYLLPTLVESRFQNKRRVYTITSVEIGGN